MPSSTTPDLFEALFDLSLTGTVLFDPVRDDAGDITDLAFARLNPAAQRLLGLSAQPDVTFRQQFPGSVASGIWAFHHDAFLADGPRELRQNYQADGYDNYYVVAARRVGEQLLVNFSDTSDHPRSAVEEALRDSQAREQEALAEARHQQQLLRQVFENAPMPLALFRGPNYRVELANPALASLWGRQVNQVVGRPVFEALPDLRDQGFEEILAGVLRTGVPFKAQEVAAVMAREHLGLPALGYFNVSYEALCEVPGQPATSIIAGAVEVTEQVRARQRVHLLNEELEARVLARTRELEMARAATERQRQQWEELFWRAPAAICIFDGPEWVYEFVNPDYQAMFPGRELLGKRLVDALPEVADQPLMDILHHVYDTGEPFQAREVLVPLARTDDGPIEDIYLDLTYLARYNEAGQIDGFITYANDVTEQVLARREREAHQGELQRIFEQAPVGIAVFRGPNHVIEMANDLQLAIWDKPLEEALGKGLFELLPEVAGQGFEERLAGVLATGEPFVGADVPARYTRHGVHEQIFVSFVYTPLREADGRIEAVVVVVSNTTEQVRARQQVEQLNQELEARVQERTREAQTARAAAERERTLLQALLTQTPVAIGLFQGEEIRITAANEMLAAMWGYTPAQVVGRPLVEGVPELRGQGFDDMIREVLRTQVPIAGTEVPAQMLRDGELKTTYYNFVYQPLYNAEGEVLGVIDVATEVTEQVEARRRIEQLNQEAQDARAEAERQRGELERVFEQAPVAIAVYRGPNYVVELANATIARLWDRTREQLLGRGIYEAMPEAAGFGYEELMDNVMATGMPFAAHEMESQHERNGHLETLYWDFVYVPMYAADGSINGVMVVATDTTAQVLARRQVEQLNQELETRVQRRTAQLTEQQALLRQILGNVPAAIATMSGPEHRYTFLNEPYQTQLGHLAVLGKPVAGALPESINQGYIDLLDRVYTTGQRYEGREVPFQLHKLTEGGKPMQYINFVYQPLADGHGRTTGIMVFAIDVTEQVLARQLVETSQLQVQELNQELAAINEELTATNEELQQSNAQLTRTNIDLDTFVYTASHDLKAPITNIEGILHALRDTLPEAVQQDPVVAHIMGLLDHTVSRFQLTIDQLTDLSRLQQTYNEPAEMLLLSPVVADVLADLAPAIDAAEARIYLDIATGLQVSFAPSSLRSVVYNLLSNAVKYRAPERPAKVWLQAEKQDKTVVLTVRDNGLGLSETQQQRLFGVFQRLHTHVEGTGVGLYMIKRLIENAGATITVTSTPNVGSTFTVVFPA